MRVLAVIEGELTSDGGAARWALLEALVAENGPHPPEVRVMAPVRDTGTQIVPQTLDYTLGIENSQDIAGPSCWTQSRRARHRLARALRYLRGLGLRASGDIEPGNTYRAVCRVAAAGGYGRVLLLSGNRSSWSNRMATRLMAARLRRSLQIPVELPGRASLSP